MKVEVSFVGAVLAGGKGSRIGGDKALQLLGDKPLVAWAARALSACSALCVVGSNQAAGLVSAVALSDPQDVPNGPLAGVLAALQWAQSLGVDYLVTVPCDTPFLPEDADVRLVAAAMERRTNTACACSDAGIEPLVAAWCVAGVLPVLETALKAGHHPPVHALMNDLNAAQVAFSRYEATNINTPELLALAQNQLKTDPHQTMPARAPRHTPRQ